MKKWAPYTLGAFALLLLVLLVLFVPYKRERKLDERITLRQRDKIPYGTFVAHQLLQATFSKAHVIQDKAAPGYWSGINTDTSNQAVFLISGTFDPDQDALRHISKFVQNGNYVFIITQHFNQDVATYLKLQDENDFLERVEDSLQLFLHTAFTGTSIYQYPGKKYDSYFSDRDSATSLALGKDAAGHTNFIQLQSGKGKLFVHLAPLAFSNYFILHKSNVHYFQNVISLIPEDVSTVVWNEYFLSRHRKSKEKEPNVLRVLWQYDAFKWGLLTLVFTLLLYVLSAMRRTQRIIPVYAKPANDSLDFVRTIGRLYYDRRDHHNLAKKMAAYFLEQVRSRYQLTQITVDENFAAALHAKSQYPYEDLKKIIDFIQYINAYTYITEEELAQFYQQLELFYKKTENGTRV